MCERWARWGLHTQRMETFVFTIGPTSLAFLTDTRRFPHDTYMAPKLHDAMR